MKTLNQINHEINEVVQVNEKRHKDSIEYSRAKKHVKFLYDVRNYLESNPSADFLNKEKERLEKKIDRIDSGFDEWLKSTPKSVYGNSKAVTFYNSVMNRQAIINQLKTINFILS